MKSLDGESGHSPVMDGHVDLIYEMMRNHEGALFENISCGPVTRDGFISGDVRVVVSALYCPDSYNGPDSSWGYLNRLLEYSDRHLESLRHIKNRKGLEDCFSEEGGAGFVCLLENADALIDGKLGTLLERAIKVVGLTHAGRNRIGDGNGVPYPEGLTREGRRLVEELHQEGFAVDVAHLSDRCFSDLIRIFDGPILTSHTGFRFFCRKPRNLDAEQIRLIVERGGIIGVTVNPEMLNSSDEAGVEDVYKHLDWVTQKYGPECVAIGSDFGGFDVPNRDIADISKLSIVADSLCSHGYPQDAISGILGGNWYRFYASILAG